MLERGSGMRKNYLKLMSYLAWTMVVGDECIDTNSGEVWRQGNGVLPQIDSLPGRFFAP
jgi:hypothetical protein